MQELNGKNVAYDEFKVEIEKFSDLHDRGDLKQLKKYQSLIPSSQPGPGQQYAFEVDMDKCTGCKACVTACHNENGLDEDETWRSVGFVQGGTTDNPAIQHITTACHHCVEPACMNGCPTLAYTKDEETGIVKHLDDQCFGCQYCILKCPYDVPKYNAKRGIVHKCDMCINRLTKDQAPACARACPNGAIRITIVDQQEVKENSNRYVNVPDSPASDYTYPTTRYTSKREFPTNMEAVDYYTLTPEHSHFPLVVMLTLTQLSVGAFLVEFVLSNFVDLYTASGFQRFHVPVALGIGLLALGSSILHLGRPHLAFRAFLGVRTSWLSREIIAFGGFAKLAILYAATHWFAPLETLLTHMMMGFSSLTILPVLVLISGIMGILSSVMVYRDTKRPFWDHPMTTFKFLTTMIILGCTTSLLTSMMLATFHPDISLSQTIASLGGSLGKVIACATAFKLVLEGSILFQLFQSHLSMLKKTALLMAGPLRKLTIIRFACGIVGGILLPLFYLQLNDQTSPMVLAGGALAIFILCLAGELLERYLFFRTAVPLKMPGGRS